jgi:hypothetical protein
MVKSEILFWVGDQRSLVLWMTGIDDVRGKERQGDDVWQLKRSNPK